MSLGYDAALRRVHKLLALSRSANEHEAARAAEQAARLMDRYAIEEAELRVADESRPAEPIERAFELRADDVRPRRNRIAWHVEIVHGVSAAFSCRFYFTGPRMLLFGRQSAVRAASYVFQYLVREIDRLSREQGREAGVRGREWYNSFRIGAAAVVSERLIAEARERKARRAAAAAGARDPGEARGGDAPGGAGGGSPADRDAAAGRPGPRPPALAPPGSRALVLVERDEREVEGEYRSFSRGFGRARPLGAVSAYDGYRAGRAAGARVPLTTARAGIGPGAARLPR